MDPTGADSSFQEAITILQPDTPAAVWADLTVAIEADLAQIA
jgi:hypothetical protein